MKSITKLLCMTWLAAFCAIDGTALADTSTLTVPSMFSDNMVLQQGKPDPIWGTAPAGDKITVVLGGTAATAVADAAGQWKSTLPKKSAGGDFDLEISDASQKIVCHHVTFGEVWLASGQSNMVFTLEWAADYNAADIASANDPDLRIFTVQQDGALAPKNDVQGAWTAATPDVAKGFSAVAYFYARNLRKALGVPVGVIVSAYGATAVETWTSIEAIDSDPAYKAEADQSISAMAAEPEAEHQFPVLVSQWQQKHSATDDTNVGLANGWANPDFDDSAWDNVDIPKDLAGYGLKSGGVVWLRKTFTLPTSATDHDFDLNLNWTDQTAITIYFNGQSLGEQDPAHRFYHRDLAAHVPKALIRAGANTVAIRITGLVPTAYDWATTSTMGIPFTDPASVDNTWKVKIEQQFPLLSADDIASLPIAPTQIIRNTYTAMYNAMLAPLIPYRIAGEIWYQGESDSTPALCQTYAQRLGLAVSDWRKRWGEGNYPFYLVQLANYYDVAKDPGPSPVAEVRWQQFLASKSIRNAAMIEAIDIGEQTIHPRNKREVGRRLAMLALSKSYGQPQVYTGPLYTGNKVQGSAIRVSFDFAAGGLVAKDGPLKWFQIAGSDRKWVWADAQIDGNDVIVSSSSVPNPVAVRYAWATNPQGCNLFNSAGLPASPFRTDDWKDF